MQDSLKLCRILLLIIVLSYSSTIRCQILSDNHWIISNYIHFEFDSNWLKSDIIQHPMQGLVTSPFNTAISSTMGELQFHSSGCFIMNENSFIIENGDSLNPGVLEIGYCKFGDALWYQNVIVVPYPNFDNRYILFTLDVGRPFPPEDTMYASLVPLNLYYHVIDMDANGGNGTVVDKNLVAISDTLARGYIQACQHANGRDWWVIVPEWNSNCYNIIYLGPHGISSPIKSCSGPIHGDLDFGASVKFSPDGKWFGRSYSWLNDTLGQINLYSFDRCTGILTHSINLKFPVELPYYTGLEFSPNGNLLYASSYKSLWQFDLSKPDIQNTLVLAGRINNDFTLERSSLYYQQLAPDGRIYIASPTGHKFLSIIHFPDNLGFDCGFKEHDLKLPMNRQNYAGLPNYPNYRLGSLDSSICDTLGINNVPVARFRYDTTSGEPHQIDFINLSYFEPDSFFWEFGDENESSIKNPTHIYSKDGVYNVCLTVSNNYGIDTYCQNIPIYFTSLIDANSSQLISISPNPAENELTVRIKEKVFPLRFIMYNVVGIEIFNEDILSEISIFSLDQIPSGLYLIKVVSKNETSIFTNTVIIQH